MLTMKTFTIFQLIEKAHWVLLSAFGVFSLCSSTESTNKAIIDCATLLSSTYSHEAFESINHKVEVCSISWNAPSLSLFSSFSLSVVTDDDKLFQWITFLFTQYSPLLSLCLDWNHLYKDHHPKPVICFHLWIFWHQHENAAFIRVYINHLSRDSIAVQLWVKWC